MITCSAKDYLLLLRPAASAIKRHLRKVLFSQKLRLPTRFRYCVDGALPACLHSDCDTTSTIRRDRRHVTVACLNAHLVRTMSALLIGCYC